MYASCAAQAGALTTNKRVAAAAACLTLLSYIATAVISATEGTHYGHNLWGELDVFGATVGVPGALALLVVGQAVSRSASRSSRR